MVANSGGPVMSMYFFGGPVPGSDFFGHSRMVLRSNEYSQATFFNRARHRRFQHSEPRCCTCTCSTCWRLVRVAFRRLHESTVLRSSSYCHDYARGALADSRVKTPLQRHPDRVTTHPLKYMKGKLNDRAENYQRRAYQRRLDGEGSHSSLFRGAATLPRARC